VSESPCPWRPLIREIPDFPKPGISFKDITPMLGNAAAFRSAVDALARRLEPHRPDAVCGAEARGFLFAGALANRMGLPLAPLRKPGKLPWRVREVRYALEYGEARLQAHEDAFAPGARVALIDDLLATGGTAAAMAELVRRGGAVPAVLGCVIELANLRPRDRLPGLAVESLLEMEG